jgi:hypothetical protein
METAKFKDLSESIKNEEMNLTRLDGNRGPATIQGRGCWKGIGSSVWYLAVGSRRSLIYFPLFKKTQPNQRKWRNQFIPHDSTANMERALSTNQNSSNLIRPSFIGN